MPKVTKLHSKGKPTKIQKACKVDKNSSVDTDPQESAREFQLQLCWCIQQLERTLAEKKGNEKQMQEAWKVLTVLKNNNQPIIRKRQLMRTHFGDYRAKMAAEEKKLAKMASKIKISDSPAQPKATFLRKSAFLSTGDSSFRFNFNIPQDAKDSEITKTNEDSNTAQISNSNPECTDSNKNEDKTVANSQNTETDKKSDSNTDNKIKDSHSNNFKFAFSGTDFKFNFDVNDTN